MISTSLAHYVSLGHFIGYVVVRFNFHKQLPLVMIFWNNICSVLSLKLLDQWFWTSSRLGWWERRYRACVVQNAYPWLLTVQLTLHCFSSLILNLLSVKSFAKFIGRWKWAESWNKNFHLNKQLSTLVFCTPLQFVSITFVVFLRNV